MPVKMNGGKNYLTVVERMDMLLTEVGKKNYSLKTEVQYEGGVFIVKATLVIFGEDSSRFYNGHALGEIGKKKCLEATETHAIGRALSSAGWFGEEFASANEIEIWNEKDDPKLKDLEVSNPRAKENVENLEKEHDVDEHQDIAVTATISGVEVKDDMKLTFGANKGKMVSECPLKYLKWLSTAELDFMKDDEGRLNVDRIKKHNDCAKYFYHLNEETEKIPF